MTALHRGSRDARCNRLGRLRRGFAQQCKGRSILSTGLAVLTALALGATLLSPPRPLLVWNASPSSPVGLYAVERLGPPRAGGLVIAFAPGPARRLAAARRYIPFDVPLVKRVAAAAGDLVCAHGRIVRINGRSAAVRRARDPAGHLMPAWSGCRRLGPGDLFLLSPGQLAFDGRYFGISKRADVIGAARLLWRA